MALVTHFNKVTASSELWGTGLNSSGELGDNTNIPKSSPVQTVAGGTDWKQVSSGGNHTAGIKTDGTLWLWGRNNEGQLGDNTNTPKSSPVQTIAGGTDWAQVSAGTDCTVAIKTDGSLWTWGFNSNGQLGDLTITNRSSPIQTVAGGTDWKYVTSTAYTTAAIKTDGSLWLWGYNDFGGLGDETIIPKSSPIQTVAGGTDWKYVVCGSGSTYAIKNDGTLWTWGRNAHGQLGDETVIHKSSPIQTVAGGTDWKYVGSKSYTVGGIKNDGTLWLWGSGNLGVLGDGTTVRKSSPVQTVAGGNDWSKIAFGLDHAAAIKVNGVPWAWGYNSNGQLGDGTTIDKSSPVQMLVGSLKWKSVGCYHSGTLINESDEVNDIDSNNFITKDYVMTVYPNLVPARKKPALWTWGNNLYGILGDGTIANKSSPVQTIAGGNDWKCVAGGEYYHSVAIKTDGTLWTWGNNTIYGALGDGTITDRSSPVQTVAGGNDWKALFQGSGGSAHTVAIKNDGTLWAWGQAVKGQLGDGTTGSKSSPVQTIAGGTDWKQAACGTQHTAAIKNDGTLWLWGNNSVGQLGDGTNLNKSSPIQTISGGTNWAQVSCGGFHTAAIKTDGTLWLWGQNSSGELGNNTIISSSSPTQEVTSDTTWVQVNCGRYHTAAIKTDGTLWLWGGGELGALGDGTATHRSSPVQTIAGGTAWKQVVCGYSFSCATKIDGSLWTWGRNADGTLGDNTTVSRSSPVQTIAGGNNWKQVGAVGWGSVLAISEGDMW